MFDTYATIVYKEIAPALPKRVINDANLHTPANTALNRFTRGSGNHGDRRTCTDGPGCLVSQPTFPHFRPVRLVEGGVSRQWRAARKQ
ncbi:hypothetical protein GCM10022267_53920 [Lentzea roselyniae]|uniref:Uncharacterized protein n=1 Tax=Lentzea roselyniae TaxID=531940 RepID=A0ABP7BHI3_9PSEU